MNAISFERQWEQKLSHIVAKTSKLYNAQLLIHSDKHHLHLPLAAGQTDDQPATADQPFHTASIGKTFTAVLIAKLYEQGKLNVEDPISKYLPKNLMEQLHIYKGKDYTKEIQIQHLLKHTSGLPDFYEDKPKTKNEKTFLQSILDDEPDRFWTPEETILWSKKHLQPYFAPGKKIHYSDTGYNLLGLIISSVTSKPYHEVLHEMIFDPLQMHASYLLHYSEPKVKGTHRIARVYFGERKIAVEEYRSLSSIFASGQTVSTTTDLLVFMQALVNGKLIRKDTLQWMQQWNRMMVGVDYGAGLMRIRFSPFTDQYVGWGHLGSTSSFLLYFPKLDVYLIGSFNQTEYQSKSMRILFVHFLRKLGKLVR